MIKIVTLATVASCATTEYRTPIRWGGTEGNPSIDIHVRWLPHLDSRIVPVKFDFSGSNFLFVRDTSLPRDYRDRRTAFVSLTPDYTDEIQQLIQLSYGTRPLDNSFFDLSPDGPFAHSVDSFMITPTYFIANPNNPESECSSLFVTSNITGDRWTFANQNNNQQLVFDGISRVELSERDYTDFMAAIVEVATEEGLVASRGRSLSPVTNGRQESELDLFIHNCDIGVLDEVLPELQYVIRGNDGNVLAISLTAMDYLINTPQDITRGHRHLENSCLVRISLVGDDHFSTIGDALFKKHAVLFNRAANTISICRAHTD